MSDLKSAGSSLPTWLAKPVSEGARYLCDPSAERRAALLLRTQDGLHIVSTFGA